MNRGNFLKTSMAVAATTTLAGAGNVFASSPTSGVVYSVQDEGKWKDKSGSHAPMIQVDHSNVHVITKHDMSEKHYIVRQTLVGADGTVLGSQTFLPTETPSSTFTLPQGYKGKLTATSFCNLHDLWISETTVQKD